MIKYLMLMNHEKEVMSNVYAKYSIHKNVHVYGILIKSKARKSENSEFL